MVALARAAMMVLVGMMTMAAGNAPDDAGYTTAPTAVVSKIIEASALPFHDDVAAGSAEAPQAKSLNELVADIGDLPELELTDEQRCMAAAVYWEAKGEPLAGQLAVAEVIRNRVESGRWADSVCGVVKQPRQFSFVRGGRWADPREREAWKTASAIALIAMSESWREVADGATSFHAVYVKPGWSGARVAVIGNHVFYR